MEEGEEGENILFQDLVVLLDLALNNLQIDNFNIFT